MDAAPTGGRPVMRFRRFQTRLLVFLLGLLAVILVVAFVVENASVTAAARDQLDEVAAAAEGLAALEEVAP